MTQNDRVLGIVGNAAIKIPVRVASTSNLTLSGEQTVAGVTCVSGDRVLVKSQTDATQNGIWDVDTGTWERAKDFDGSYDAVQGTLIPVYRGAGTYALYAISNTDPVVIDTSSLTFETVDDVALAALLASTSDVSLGDGLVGVKLEATGATGRTQHSKNADIVSVFDFMTAAQIADIQGATFALDVSTAHQAALDYANAHNTELYHPAGGYGLGSGLLITGTSSAGKIISLRGVGGQVDGNVPATIFKWTGSDSSSNTLFKADGIAKFICKGISFYGASKVGKVFWATKNGGTYSPFGWAFEDCTFEAAKTAGYGFYIDASSALARFRFVGCQFRAGVGTTGFYSSNPNSVSHTFLQCSFDVNDYGIQINGGGFIAVGCEFATNALSDVYLQVSNPCTLMGCWTEQSRQFIKTDSSGSFTPLTLINCQVASYPWSYWKVDEAGRTQPTNDFTQWIAVSWARPGPLTMIGCVFTDPYNGAVTGSVAPTTSSTIMTVVPFGLSSSPLFNNIGSVSQSGTDTFTSQFFQYGSNNNSAPTLPYRKRYFNQGNLGAGSYTLHPEYYSTWQVTLTGNHAYTMDVSASVAGDKFKLIVVQGGVGSFTTTFVNAKLVGGGFVPTATVAAKSVISFEFDGSNWIEESRGLNLS